MSQMLKSSGLMAAATMTSRLLGMVREIVYASFMGDSWVAGVFQFAFAIPNLFRRLLGEGALTAAFIPIFKEKEKNESETEMWRAANAVISGLVVSASIIVVLVMMGISAYLAWRPQGREGANEFAANNIEDVRSLSRRLGKQTDSISAYVWQQLPQATQAMLLAYDGTRAKKEAICAALSADFERIVHAGPLFDAQRFSGVGLLPRTQKLLTGQPQGDRLVQLNRLLLEDAFPLEISDRVVWRELMLRLLRIMFPYMLVICLTAVFMGMLNARGHFFIPASGALIMNSVMIASVYFLAPRLGRTLPEQIFALAFGVLVAGVAQALFQLPPLRGEGFRYHWVSPFGNETVSRVVRQMIPGAIGVAAFQLNVLVTQGIALHVDPTINASFQYAVRLMELPQGVFGISLATYMLPALSGLAVEKKTGEFKSTLVQGLDHIIFINLLAAMFLLVLATPMIRLLFEHKAFTAESTRRAAFALASLSPALVAFSLSNILARAFYALGDTKTPMKISIACLLVNMVFAVAMVNPLRQGGLGLANSISSICNTSILFYALTRKLGGLGMKSSQRMILQMAGCVLVAGLVAWGLSRWWQSHIGHAGLIQRLGDVFVPMTAAAAVYWGLALWLKIPPAMELGKFLLARVGIRSAK